MSSSFRRRATAASAAVAAASSLGLVLATASVPASAADRSTFTIVGTSDVYDSSLVQSVLEPGFEAAYPQYDLQYVSKGTGAAITYAEAGTADALIVHAASLENQFVADGFSTEPYGRAAFYGDYVLLGPAGDPAAVQSNAPHDIATAFERVAAAGAAGQADFVSRGGTPGTTVAEHAIWARTSTVPSCTVSAANGGGTSPSTTPGDCPATIPYPGWYHATGLTQGPNITAADTCSFSSGKCYVLTDRGTYQYLLKTGAISASNLHVVSDANAATARGGANLLVNSFHTYAVNAAKFAGDANVHLNTAAAAAFQTWVTSPAAQAAVGRYLADQPGGAPFKPSAAPSLTATASSSAVAAGRTFTVSGTLANVVPGTPALAGRTVRLQAVPASTPAEPPRTVATAKTDASGDYRISFTPKVTQYYSVSTQEISQVEDATLNPVFGDLLAGTSASAGRVQETGTPGIRTAGHDGHQLVLRGAVSPTVQGKGAHLSLYAVRTKNAGDHALRYLGRRSLSSGQSSYKVSYRLASGSWTYELRYSNPKVIATGASRTRTVTIR